MKSKKPKIFLFLKLIGFGLLITGIILIVMGFTKDVPSMGSQGWFEESSIQMGLEFGGSVCIFLSIVFISLGFTTEIRRIGTKTVKYIQEENKEDLTDIVNNTADIAGGAITKTVRAVKKGIKDTVYCKHCGNEIDSDSKFCKKCGGEQ